MNDNEGVNAMASTQGVSLDQIANADRIRTQQDAKHDSTTKRRRGHKGTRSWGYQTSGGKRIRRD